MKKYLSTAAFFGMSLSVYAQEVAAQSAAAADPHLFQKIMTTSIFVAGTVVVVAAILMLLRLSEILSKNIVNQYLTDTNNGATAAIPKKQGKSLLQRLTDAVPVDKQDDIAFDHAFDGIRELDNKLPPWWVWMFYITIAIGVVYFTYYHILDGDSSVEEYKKEMAAAEEAKKAYLATLGSQIDENNVTVATDAESLEAGAVTFTTYCAACHAADGGGQVGPNLTDEYWLHGGSIKDVFKTVKYGVPAKGMISWESQLTAPQIQKVASYILSLKGTKPAAPKEPQGELYKGEATSAPKDTTAAAEM